MKKTLIASAIAAVAFSGTAMAQNPAVGEDRADALAERIDSWPEVFGNIQLAVVYTDVDNGPSGLEHRDNGTTLGVKHSHEFAPGVRGFLHLELEGIPADDKAGPGGIEELDEAFIGVEGDAFGRIWVGTDDSTYEVAIDEIANYFEAADLSIGGGYDTGEGDLVQYRSPSFAGLRVNAAVQVNGDNDNRTAGEESYPYQLALTYEMDAFEFAVAMDSNDGNTPYSGIFSYDDDLDTVISGSPNNSNTYGARVSWDQDNLRLSALFQTRDDIGEKMGVLAAYSLGANIFAAAWERADLDDGTEADVFTLQALHNLSDHMYLYVEGYLGEGSDDYFDTGAGDLDGNQNEAQVLAVGGVYYF